MRINKKAKLTTNEIMELLLAAAGIIIVTFLLYRLIAPGFNIEDEIAESYFDSFEKAIETADKGGTGVFSIWQPEKDTNYFLIYFGTKISYEKDDLEFFSISANSNKVCICYLKKQETSCDHCENLEYPLKKDEDFNQFQLKFNEEIKIIKLPHENFYNVVQG